MRRSLLHLWLGSGVLACAVLVGCRTSEQAPGAPGVPPGTLGRTNRPAEPPLAVRPAEEVVVVTPYQPRVQVIQDTVAASPAVTPVQSHPVAKLPEVLPVSHNPGDVVPIVTVPAENEERQSLGGKIREHLHDRRSFRDITARPDFAHDSNYHWLVGTLEHGKEPNSWTLRYASVDEDDRYGGRVSLIVPQPLSGFQPGQLVRVEGQVADPSTTAYSPDYQVQSILPSPAE